jgi:outer membrane protein assembly factor BamB
MKKLLAGLVLLVSIPAMAGLQTYNTLETINLRDQGLPADERATHCLIAVGDSVYGVTSGDRCHVFRCDPAAGTVSVLATIEGPNTVMRGLVRMGDSLYIGTCLSRDQIWLNQRRKDSAFDPEDVNLLPLPSELPTGHLYRLSGFETETPQLIDLGQLVPGEGIHTLAADRDRGLLYGVTSRMGEFFIHDPKRGKTDTLSFGNTYSTVSNHRVGYVEVEKELADLIPGEGEWNNRLLPKAMLVASDGCLYTSGWNGHFLKYNPAIESATERFSVIDWIPSVAGRQYWNRIDAMVEDRGHLYLGTSDGYILRYTLSTGELRNYGKPVRAIEVAGLAVSPLDGRLYGVNGGNLEGMSRPWSLDPALGTFDIDLGSFPVVLNRRAIGDVAVTRNGTLVFAEATRVANLFTLSPGEPHDWPKSGILPEANPQEERTARAEGDRFAGRKMLEVEVFPIPSTMHGGSGYTAIQADRDGRVYVGTAYYGKRAELVQLDPRTAEWRSVLQSDKFTYQYGRGQGIPGKIHTKLRLGEDGKIYGAMKQGYELHYALRADVGEAPEGVRGSQFTCYFFSYDPATDTAESLGPGWPQEGITSLAVDTERGYLYGATVPGVFFLVNDLENRRIWNAGAMAHSHPSRYMPSDPGTGRVYHFGETSPEGRHFLSVWDPQDFRLHDVEVKAEEGYDYSHSYATCCGPAGTKTLYGFADDHLFEMDLDASKDGTFHVRPVCPIGVEGASEHNGLYAIERGPDGRIYWASNGGRGVPIDLFAWDPKTETKTYLGSCASQGEWFDWNYTQGLCLDPEGNMALHILYAELTDKQKQNWRVPQDFFYEDIPVQPHYLGYPSHDEGTYYAVYYIKNATAIR